MGFWWWVKSTALSQTKLRTKISPSWFLWCRGTTKRRACHQVEAMLVLVLVFTCHRSKWVWWLWSPWNKNKEGKATRPSQALKSWISCAVPQLVISGRAWKQQQFRSSFVSQKSLQNCKLKITTMIQGASRFHTAKSCKISPFFSIFWSFHAYHLGRWCHRLGQSGGTISQRFPKRT